MKRRTLAAVLTAVGAYLLLRLVVPPHVWEARYGALVPPGDDFDPFARPLPADWPPTIVARD